MLRQLSYIVILWILMIINGLANEWIHMESVSSGSGELFSWESRASEDLMHTCQVYLKGKGAAELEKAVMDVSDPSSRNYGKHLSKAEVDRMTSDPEGRAVVAEYLRASGLRVLQEDAPSPSPSLLAAEGTVRAWSIALHTEFFEVHRNGPGPRQAAAGRQDAPFIRCRQYSLPASVAGHVASVLGTVQLPVELRRGGPHILGV